MATSYKVLGQVAPLSGNATTLYTVPSSTEAVISSITVCNRAATSSTYRIAVTPDGAIIADKNYIFFDVAIDRNSTQAPTIGITLNAGDVITVYSSTSDLSFSAFGTEITA